MDKEQEGKDRKSGMKNGGERRGQGREGWWDLQDFSLMDSDESPATNWAEKEREIERFILVHHKLHEHIQCLSFIFFINSLF